MYGTVPPTSLLAVKALRVGPRARSIDERNTSTGTKLYGLAKRSSSMPVSTANGVKAIVVLVVEDEFFVRCGVANALREAGYSVVECGSGEQAVAFCRSKA